MAINDFEALSVLMYALKNRKYNIKQIKNHADLKVFNSKEENIIEIKASNTNGNPTKRVVSEAQINSAVAQLDKYKKKNPKGTKNYFILTSYGSEWSMSDDYKTVDIYDVTSMLNAEHNPLYKYKMLHYKKTATKKINYSSDMTEIECVLIDEIQKLFSVSKPKATLFIIRQKDIIKNDSTGVIVYNEKSLKGIIQGRIDLDELNKFASEENIDVKIDEKDIQNWIDSEMSYTSHIKEVNSEENPKKRFSILFDELSLIESESERIATALILCFWMEEQWK